MQTVLQPAPPLKNPSEVDDLDAVVEPLALELSLTDPEDHERLTWLRESIVAPRPAAGRRRRPALPQPRHRDRRPHPGRPDRARQGRAPLPARCRARFRGLRHPHGLRRAQALVPRPRLGRAPAAPHPGAARPRSSARRSACATSSAATRSTPSSPSPSGCPAPTWPRPAAARPATTRRPSTRRRRPAPASPTTSSSPRARPRPSPSATRSAAPSRGSPSGSASSCGLRFVDELHPEPRSATSIGVSQMQVSRILRGVLDRLRAELDDEPPHGVRRHRRLRRRRAGTDFRGAVVRPRPARYRPAHACPPPHRRGAPRARRRCGRRRLLLRHAPSSRPARATPRTTPAP